MELLFGAPVATQYTPHSGRIVGHSEVMPAAVLHGCRSLPNLGKPGFRNGTPVLSRSYRKSHCVRFGVTIQRNPSGCLGSLLAYSVWDRFVAWLGWDNCWWVASMANSQTDVKCGKMDQIF
jgi:hypothetical protein